MSDAIEVAYVESGSELEEIRSLFLEYAQSLNFSLCFQSFDKELQDLPGRYAPPQGRLILCRMNGAAAGCIALKPLHNGLCEMKRLFVRPEFRGKSIGLKLVTRLIEDAKQIGYPAMRLDTIAGKMDPAIALYRRLGFKEIPPYYENPVPGAAFFELAIK
jgi:ribosomal protein S18 acetylase RimI-like enzyme